MNDSMITQSISNMHNLYYTTMPFSVQLQTAYHWSKGQCGAFAMHPVGYFNSVGVNFPEFFRKQAGLRPAMMPLAAVSMMSP